MILTDDEKTSLWKHINELRLTLYGFSGMTDDARLDVIESHAEKLKLRIDEIRAMKKIDDAKSIL